MAGEGATMVALLPFSAAVWCMGKRGRESESECARVWTPTFPPSGSIGYVDVGVWPPRVTHGLHAIVHCYCPWPI